VQRFQQRFGKDAREWREGPVKRGRELAKQGRLEAALVAYQQGLERQPANWALMSEVAHLLTFGLGAAQAGADVARAGLLRNPNCSAELWNVLGDSLYNLGRVEESFLCFRRALRVNPEDVRAHYNLVFVYVRTGQHARALRAIADALALDRDGAYAEDLLNKQREVLAQMAQGRQRRYRLLADRIISPRPPVAWERAFRAKSGELGAGGTMGGTPFSA
jgi:tetratricopeptide (TPR) repeat protein